MKLLAARHYFTRGYWRSMSRAIADAKAGIEGGATVRGTTRRMHDEHVRRVEGASPPR